MSRRCPAVRATLVVLLAGTAAVIGLLQIPSAGAAVVAAAKPRTFTRENYATLVSNPDQYKGARVDISGKIFAPPQVPSSKRGITVQTYMDPKNSTWNTVIRYKNSGLRFAQGDYIHVVGTVQGTATSKDTSGASVNGVAVTASSIKKTDAIAAASLPLRVATTRGYSTTQNGVTVAITTVEFAPDETRAFVTVVNGSQANASFSAASSHAVQNSQSFDTRPNRDYPQVASEVKPGVTSSGIVVFGPLDPQLATQLTFQVTEGPGAQFTPFSFDIAPTG
jgi:hypothetical protein